MKPAPTAPVIAWKPLGGFDLASARLRAHLPCRYLRARGWNASLYAASSPRRYDAVVFQKSYSDTDIAFAERLREDGCKVVLDLCDNHFYNPGADPALAERAVRLRRMIAVADEIAVSSVALGRVVEEEMARPATVIDDAVHSPPLNSAKRILHHWHARALAGSALRVVWFGSAGTENPPFGLIDTARIVPALERLHRSRPLRLTVISDSEPLFEKYLGGVGFPTAFCKWKAATFPYLLRTQDVCIVPIGLNPFTVCKTNNRPLLSLLSGVPVVADCIPSYEEFSDFVLFGDYEDNLRRYADDASLRTAHVAAGRRFIEAKYAPEAIAAQWEALFRRILPTPPAIASAR